MFSDRLETSVEESTTIPQDAVASTTTSLQLTNTEIAGLRAMIRESEERRMTEINNRNISEINNRINMQRMLSNSEKVSPIINNTRNVMYTTSENRPTRLFTEDLTIKNRLNTTNMTQNSKKSNINIQKLSDINLKRKPPTLNPGSSAIQYLDWADSMEKFLRVCGNLDEYLYDEKNNEYINEDEEYEAIQTMQFIQCKLDESIQDNNEARSLVSLINEENVQKWWKIIQDLYFPLHAASRNSRCEEFEDLKQFPGEPTSLFTARILKHARMLQKQGEDISENKLTKVFCRGISPAFKERLENYSLSLDQVTFEKMKAFGEKLDSIRISTPTKILNFVNANANLEYEAQNRKINLFRTSELHNDQKQFQYSPKNQSSIKCYYCQKLWNRKSECRKRKADQLNSSSNYENNPYLNRDNNRETRRKYQNRSSIENMKNDDTPDTGDTGNKLRNFKQLPNTSAITSTSRIITNNDKYKRNNSHYSNSSDIFNINLRDNNTKLP